MPVFAFTKSAKTLSEKVTLVISGQYCLHASRGENETEVKFTLKTNNHKRRTQPLKHQRILTSPIRKCQSKKQNL